MHNSLDFGPLLAPLWSFAPVILVGLSGAGALRMALTVLEQVLGHHRKASAAFVSVLLGVFGATSLLVAWRGVALRQGLFVGRPYAGLAGAEETTSLLARLDQVPPYALALLTFGVMLAVAALLGPAARQGQGAGADARRHLRQIRAELKGRQGEDAVIVVLARLGLPGLHDVILEDERGLTQVDHLVRLPHGIAVLETKTYGGVVTGRPWAKEWTQHLGKGNARTAFQNPLLQNYRHVEAVRQAVGADVPVHGLVVSAGTARFCPDLVEAVVPLAELALQLASLPTEACDDAMLDAAWRELTTASARSPALQAAHLEQVQGRSTARAGATWA